MILPLDLTCGNLPLNFSVGDDYEAYYRAIRNRLRGVISDDKVITGTTSAFRPGVNIGPWLRPDPAVSGPRPPLEWWSWIDGGYKPMPYKIGSLAHSITLEADPTANLAQTLQNKSGTVALLYDIYVPRPTIILSGATPAITWSAADMFVYRLTANATPTFAGMVGGDRILIAVQNNSTKFTITYPSTVKWPGGTPPVQPVGTAGVNAVGLWDFRHIHGNVYGTLRGSTVASPTPGVDTDPNEAAPPTYGQPYISIPTHNLP